MSSATKNARVVIIGAGPAGLTAAHELVTRSQIKPLILEASGDVGGISRTIEYKGNRMDIGGHRFFSKSDWVMNWWRAILPMPDAKVAPTDLLNFIPSEERVMLVRSRLSRIYFLRRFFDYPISLSLATMRNLGPWRLMKIGASYAWASIFPRRPERNLEDFFINRFGMELYRTFFKDYTEKVWGVPCRSISPAWGAQRVKGLSVLNAIAHALRKIVSGKQDGIHQKATQTSLIEKFLYPKYGPGQMWQVVAERVVGAGGELRHGCTVCGVRRTEDRISAVVYRKDDGRLVEEACDYVISTMPLRDLVVGMDPPPPPPVAAVAKGLMYRDFITVGVLLRKLRKSQYTIAGSTTNLLPDTWIYVQEPDVRLGRLQCFNNWSPALVRDASSVWLGLEYFCDEDDDLWSRTDQEMGQLAVEELAKIGLVETADVLDFHVVRVPKAYPAYFGTYDRFEELQRFTDGINNLYLVGRNGMHRYNNQDHSMITARIAVDQILSGTTTKSEIWSVNIDDDYHEEKSTSSR